MEIDALIIFAGALFVVAGSPGASIAALVARALTSGFRDVLPFLAALWIGEAVWLTMAVWGLAAIADSFQLFFLVIKWIGTIYLLFLAWTMFHAPGDVTRGRLPDTGSRPMMFFAGLTVSLGNPKVMMFYVALLPTIIDLSQLTIIGWGELVATMLLVLMGVDLTWTLLANRMKFVLKKPATVRVINRICAGIMVAAASAIAVR